jgi:hypothetical protein
VFLRRTFNERCWWCPHVSNIITEIAQSLHVVVSASVKKLGQVYSRCHLQTSFALHKTYQHLQDHHLDSELPTAEKSELSKWLPIIHRHILAPVVHIWVVQLQVKVQVQSFGHIMPITSTGKYRGALPIAKPTGASPMTFRSRPPSTWAVLQVDNGEEGVIMIAMGIRVDDGEEGVIMIAMGVRVNDGEEGVIMIAMGIQVGCHVSSSCLLWVKPERMGGDSYIIVGLKPLLQKFCWSLLTLHCNVPLLDPKVWHLERQAGIINLKFHHLPSSEEHSKLIWVHRFNFGQWWATSISSLLIYFIVRYDPDY